MFVPHRRPHGKVKRARLCVSCTDVYINLHEDRFNVLLYSCLNVLGGVGDGYARWRDVISEHVEDRCDMNVPDTRETARYKQLFMANRSNNGRNGPLKDALLAVERTLSLSDIMRLRREALGWRFLVDEAGQVLFHRTDSTKTCDTTPVQSSVPDSVEDVPDISSSPSGAVPKPSLGRSGVSRRSTCMQDSLASAPHDACPLDYARPVYHRHQRLHYAPPSSPTSGAQEGTAEYASQQNSLLSSYIMNKRPYYDDVCAPLREVQVDFERLSNVTIKIYRAQGEDYQAFPYSGGTLVTTLCADHAKCYACVLLIRNPNPPYGYMGATDDTCEPDSAWFDFYAGMSDYIITWHHPERHNSVAATSTIIESKHGHHWSGDDSSSHQATLAFTRESSGAMSLHVVCVDSIMNALMMKELQVTLTLLLGVLKLRRIFDAEKKALKEALLACDTGGVPENIPCKSHAMPHAGPVDTAESPGGTGVEAVLDGYDRDRGGRGEEEEDISFVRSLNESLEPASANMFLWNMVVGAEMKFWNVDVLLPTTEVKIPSVASSIPAGLLKVNTSLRILSGQEKENFKLDCSSVQLAMGQCTTTHNKSLHSTHGSLRWSPTLAQGNPVLTMDRIGIKYTCRVEDMPLSTRCGQDLMVQIKDCCDGSLKSRVAVSLNDAHVHEFSFGVKNPLIARPQVVVKIKHRRASDSSVVASKQISSTSRNTRTPTFCTSVIFLIDDEASYSSTTELSNYTIEFILYDEGRDAFAHKRMVGWGASSVDSNCVGKWKDGVIKDATETEIGSIRYGCKLRDSCCAVACLTIVICSVKIEFSTPLVGVFVSDVRCFDMDSLRSGWGATSSKGTVHVAATVSSVAPCMDSPEVISSSTSRDTTTPVRSTTSRALASTMQFHEKLFFPLTSSDEELQLKIELCTDEYGCREVAFASADVKFRGDMFEETLQMRDSCNDVLASATVCIRYGKWSMHRSCCCNFVISAILSVSVYAAG